MIVRADLHVHTPASDGRSELSELIRAAKEQGLAALAICDHNLCTPLPQSDFMLIPATEISTDIGHILGLFVKNMDINRLRENGLPSGRAAVDAIHAHGGIAVLAHPFEWESAREEQFEGIDFDLIETANSRAPMKRKDANDRAKTYAQTRRLPETGGSDAHGVDELGGSYTEIECEDLSELELALRAGRTRAVFVRRCRWVQKGKTRLILATKDPNWKKLLKAAVYFLYTLLREVFGL